MHSLPRCVTVVSNNALLHAIQIKYSFCQQTWSRYVIFIFPYLSEVFCILLQFGLRLVAYLVSKLSR